MWNIDSSPRRRAEGTLVIDVREHMEFARGHVPGTRPCR